ncbi:glycosyltransferase family A protein [Alteromonas genovensis]|uniref:glycosyltransferase family A protein n=1 Tax=Alteromonas genovensis TaxID=471225 RepID=UPI002FE14637
MSTSVTVIIPTTAESSRSDGLRKAILSVRASSKDDVQILCYVNGKIFDDDVCTWLKKQDDVKFVYDSYGSLPNAIYQARKLVETEFFAFLDDDDELIGPSIDYRLSLFERNSEFDLVVGNGVRKSNGSVQLMQENLKHCQDAPLRSLLNKNGNWLASCAGLYRADSFDADFFKECVPYAEWTFFAYKAALTYSIGFVDEKTYAINFTENSLSGSIKYLIGQHKVLKRILALPLPLDVRHAIELRRSDAAHYVSDEALNFGDRSLALKYHLLSLSTLWGFKKYFLFSRYFFKPRFAKGNEVNGK